MPLYRVDRPGLPTRLLYAKTVRGAKSHILKQEADKIEVASVTPLEGAILAQQGVPVETIGVGPDQVFADCPPQARRGHMKPPVLAEPQREGFGEMIKDWPDAPPVDHTGEQPWPTAGAAGLSPMEGFED